MKYPDKLLDGLVNYHLKNKYNITIEEIRQQEKQQKKEKGKTEGWWVIYAFRDREEEENFEKYCLAEIKKIYKNSSPTEVQHHYNMICFLIAPASPYLFTPAAKPGQLF